jgi:hypothetical protein
MMMPYLLQFAFLFVLPVAYIPLVWTYSRQLWHADLCGCAALVLSAAMCFSWARFCGASSTSRNRCQLSLPIGSGECLETDPQSVVLKAGKTQAHLLVHLSNHLTGPLGWLLAGLAMLIVAVLFWSPWLAWQAMAVVSLDVLRRLTNRTDRPAASTWLLLLLLLLLPVVPAWDSQFASWFQRVSSRAGSLVLDFFACDHLLADGMFAVPGQKWSVETLYRGVFSPFTLGAAATIFVVWMRRSLVHALFMLGASIFWALVGNVICTTCVAGMYERYRWDLSAGMGYSLLETAWFGLGLWMLFCTDRLLLSLLAPNPTGKEYGRPHFTWPWMRERRGIGY